MLDIYRGVFCKYTCCQVEGVLFYSWFAESFYDELMWNFSELSNMIFFFRLLTSQIVWQWASLALQELTLLGHYILVFTYLFYLFIWVSFDSSWFLKNWSSLSVEFTFAEILVFLIIPLMSIGPIGIGLSCVLLITFYWCKCNNTNFSVYFLFIY